MARKHKHKRHFVFVGKQNACYECKCGNDLYVRIVWRGNRVYLPKISVLNKEEAYDPITPDYGDDEE